MQTPARTCFLLNQKQPTQPLCIWTTATGSSLRLPPKPGTRDVTSSLFLFLCLTHTHTPTHTHTHTHTHTTSRLYSLCLFRLVSLDWRAPQTVFNTPQALRRRHTAAGRWSSSLFMNQVQPKYIWAKDRWPAHIGTGRKKEGGDSYLAPAPIKHPPHFYQGGRWVPAQRGLFNVLSPLWYDTW